jgi:Protein of unknown function (DUF551)
MSGCQPVTTAPKDGTVILTFQANSMSGPKVKVVYWREDTVPKGWGTSDYSPTHWMPMPTPPNETEGRLMAGPSI